MTKLLAILAAWIVVFIIGMGGLFSQQTGFMAICLVGWTPLAIAFGYYWRASGVRITTMKEMIPERKQPEKKETIQPVKQRVQKRIRRIEQ